MISAPANHSYRQRRGEFRLIAISFTINQSRLISHRDTFYELFFWDVFGIGVADDCVKSRRFSYSYSRCLEGGAISRNLQA